MCLLQGVYFINQSSTNEYVSWQSSGRKIDNKQVIKFVITSFFLTTTSCLCVADRLQLTNYCLLLSSFPQKKEGEHDVFYSIERKYRTPISCFFKVALHNEICNYYKERKRREKYPLYTCKWTRLLCRAA